MAQRIPPLLVAAQRRQRIKRVFKEMRYRLPHCIMNPLISLLAPLALLVPAPGRAPAPATSTAPNTELTPRPQSPEMPIASSFDSLDIAEVPVAGQVRIEHRVIVRIAPPGPALRQSFVSEARQTDAAERLIERKMGKCVAVSGIAAVQPEAGSKLLLFMRDRRLVSADLEKACSARDFYSGFYLERSGDGMLCVDRDRLHSRSGAKCEISRMRQLVTGED